MRGGSVDKYLAIINQLIAGIEHAIENNTTVYLNLCLLDVKRQLKELTDEQV